MGTTTEKLQKLLETKAAIKKAIIDKGVEVGEDVVFADYPAKISAIEAGGGEVVNPYYEEFFNLRTSNGTNMKGLFHYCSVSELDLRNLDVSAVTNMAYMFDYCTSNVNVKGWDTSKVTNTERMFNYFAGSIDLSKLDFSSVTNVNYMFNGANINGINLTGLSFPSAISLGYLFYSAEGDLLDLLDLSSWDISNITNMTYMFYSAKFKKIDLTGWKTTNVTDMGTMFLSYNSDMTELIIPDWDMTNTTKYTNFFNSDSSYHKTLMLIDLSRSNDVTITKIASTLPTRTTTTFGKVMIPSESSQDAINALIAKYWKPVGPRIDMTSCEIATELDEIKPGKSTKLYYNPEPWYANDVNVEYVLSDESVATIDKETMTITSTGIEGTTEITARMIDTQEVISEPKVFSVSEADNYPNVIKFRGISTPNSNNYIYVNGMSASDRVLLSDMNYNSASGIYTYDAGEPITRMRFQRSDNCTEVVKLNTNNMTDMTSMFSDCSNLTSLDLSDFNTSQVTTMETMFSSCRRLTQLDLSSFDTSQVTNMRSMFNTCESLTSLDLSNFNTSQVTTMGTIFQSCYNLTSLDISNFDLTKMYSVSNILSGCRSLHTLRLDNCNYDTIKKIITSFGFPTGTIEGAIRKIYCKYSAAYDLTPPDGWNFVLVD